MGSKNNPKKRAENKGKGKKAYNGQDVKPVMYFGKWLGHGNYIAATLESGQLVMVDGKPIAYADV